MRTLIGGLSVNDKAVRAGGEGGRATADRVALFGANSPALEEDEGRSRGMGEKTWEQIAALSPRFNPQKRLPLLNKLDYLPHDEHDEHDDQALAAAKRQLPPPPPPPRQQQQEQQQQQQQQQQQYQKQKQHKHAEACQDGHRRWKLINIKIKTLSCTMPRGEFLNIILLLHSSRS